MPEGSTTPTETAGAAAAPLPGVSVPGVGDLGHRGIKTALFALKAGPLAILVILVVVLSVLSDTFHSFENVGNVLTRSAVVSVLALGQLLVILTRGIDLSVGSNVSLSAVVCVVVFRDTNSGWQAIVAAIAVGTLVGLVNGLLYVKGRLPHPFIATLAMLSVAAGLAQLVVHSKTVVGAPKIVDTLGDGRIKWVPGGSGPQGWFPYATVVVVVVGLLTMVMLRRMVWGRWIYAVGGSPEAAQRTGIPIGAVLISVYVLCGLGAGVAAVLTVGKGDSASPFSGTGLELDAIAAVIIGGASFLGGRGKVVNAITGALIIAVMHNGLNLLNIEANWQNIAVGAIIVLAVEIDVLRRHLESRFRGIQARMS
ncbi:MAG: ABC transporter permease [Actinomycetota bacterium]